MRDFKIRASACGSIMGVKGLGKTGQSYCKSWLTEQIFNRRKDFTSKYTDKGNECEDSSLEFVADQLDLGIVFKNEIHFDNDFMTGTPDVIINNLIIDVKNSWDCFTFPFHEKELPDKDYYWQAQVYMELVGVDHYSVIYVLSDTPENIIYRDMKSYAYQNGIDDIDADLWDLFERKHTYPDIDDSLKIKIFDIERNDSDIQKIKDRVLECREFIKSIT